MKLTCPSLKIITLILLLAGVSSFYLIPKPVGASGSGSGSRKRSPRSPFSHKISQDVSEKARTVNANQTIPVIVQLNDKANPNFDSELKKKSGRLKATLRQFNARIVDLPAKSVDELASRPDVDFISLDRQNYSFGHVTTTT